MIINSYIGRSWFIYNDLLFIETYDSKGEVHYVIEDQVIEKNLCNKKKIENDR